MNIKYRKNTHSKR